MPEMLLVIHPAPEWITALHDHAPVLAMTCTPILLVAILAFTFLMMKRRDLAAIQEADDQFLGALQSAPHALALYQDPQTFVGSPRWQIYLAACRELCFYLLGTDQVEKNFPIRLRAAGRIMPSQMSAVARAMQLASGECILALQSLSPGILVSSLLLPLLGVLGTAAVLLSATMWNSSQPDRQHLLLPAGIPLVLSVLAVLVLLPLARGLACRLRAHETRLQLFPLSLANLLERVFVDHRQSLEELPSVAALGAPHRPNLSLPPTGPASRTPV